MSHEALANKTQTLYIDAVRVEAKGTGEGTRLTRLLQTLIVFTKHNTNKP